MSAYNNPSIPPKNPPSKPPNIESIPRKLNSFIIVPPSVFDLLCITKEIPDCIKAYTVKLDVSF